ncbi:MAG TPA: hypothetical protein VM536_19545 [Chloroflexia bacterium]|nr:hypothetical protein [Chloroflexia bacterium]
MAKRVIMHLVGEDPIEAEVEHLPKAGENYIEITNPRRRDGRPLNYVTGGARSFIFPWTRITFIEVMVSEAEHREVIEFFREDR